MTQSSKDKAEKMVEVLLDEAKALSPAESIELIKVYAMLAQAEATEQLATATWSLGDSVERAGR